MLLGAEGDVVDDGAFVFRRRQVMVGYNLSPKADGWKLKKAGAERASKRASTKQELVSSQADFFDGKTASVRIHKADGTIEEKRT